MSTPLRSKSFFPVALAIMLSFLTALGCFLLWVVLEHGAQ